ncbi:hypothetical protein ARC20_13485 [Stenotrophomonas panacihumi]|uniref:DUF998 domain-containing protein n=1 Tax=Stenotrophomonas panacihumi TaxID=676599 RepID=A0A0R0AEH8_9GAMM|nr:DUF998 domain-containing protein [Stenotrophomonas panacihumi]KRG39879.1 hypothetical protein ARC20_13485 [Stenotrophomonas panacihumi]PTN55164.1 DUF998 domain-containing protein [Stenotrophomonas panacihumi]
MGRNERWGRWAATGLLPWLVVVVAAFGLAIPVYSQWRYPVTLLGGIGVDHATAFNVLAMIVPGLAAAFAAVTAFGAGATRSWPHRVGVQLLFLSGLAFAGLGVFPLDSANFEGVATQRHSAAWLLWEVSFIPAMLALGMAMQARDRTLAGLCWVAGALVLVTGFVPLLPAPLAQRVGFLAWAGWFGLAAWRWPARA